MCRMLVGWLVGWLQWVRFLRWVRWWGRPCWTVCGCWGDYSWHGGRREPSTETPEEVGRRAVACNPCDISSVGFSPMPCVVLSLCLITILTNRLASGTVPLHFQTTTHLTLAYFCRPPQAWWRAEWAWKWPQ